MKIFPFVFPFIFVGMWLLVTFIISRLGWNSLVAKYEFQGDFTGKRVGMISGSINSANYNNALVLKYNEEGIFLKTVFLFKLFHKPILIPWNEIKQVQERKILFMKHKELVIGDPFVAVIKLSGKTFDEISQTYELHKNDKSFKI